MPTPVTPLRDRLMAKVVIPDDPDDCWGWIGSVSADGYANIRDAGTTTHASRAAFKVLIGPIPEGTSVLHRCDNSLCCNPRHLYAGTQSQNMRDRIERRGSWEGEKNPNARLTQADVDAIRGDSRTHQEIALDYGVSRQTITKIKSHERWSRVL